MAVQPLLPAYVLHSRRYRDSSLILDLYTSDQGRTAGIAKGVLSARRGSGRPQPFQPLLVDLRGRGELRTLTTIDPVGLPLALAGTALYCGLYLNELLLKLTARDDPCAPLYEFYAQAIGELAAGEAVEPVLRRFEVALLEQLGHGLQLRTDHAGQALDAGGRYNYEIGTGAIPVAAPVSDTVGGDTLLALEAGTFEEPRQQREARQLMRHVLNHYLDGRRLRSRELFRGLQK